METQMILLISLVALLLLAAGFLFNRLIRDKNLMREGWSGIDVQLKRRADLIPLLVDAVKGYSSHEKKLFEEVAASHTQGQIVGGLKNLLGLAERYPDLKASQNFLKLQKDLVEIEDNLQYARRYYNGCARNYNVRVQSFPGLIVARLFGFQPVDFFEIEYATERQVPEVKV